MTYEDFIDYVAEEVDEPKAWPKSGNLTSREMRYATNAALAIGTEVPLNSFPVSTFSSVTLSSTNMANTLYKYDLPDDVFRYRQDLGIVKLNIDGVDRSLQAALPFEVLRRNSKNRYQSSQDQFSFNLQSRQLYVLNGPDVDLHYLKEFTNPGTGNSGNDYPLEGTKADRAIYMVAAHVLGQDMRDPAAAQFQTLLRQDLTN